MNKNVRIVLILAVVAAGAYVFYRWYQARVAASGTGSATGQLGTNLNSIAPELVGGSQAGGTKVSPAVDVPVNITMSSSSTMPALTGTPESVMQPMGANTASPLSSQSTSAGTAGDQGSTASDVNGSSSDDGSSGVQNPSTPTDKSGGPSGMGANAHWITSSQYQSLSRAGVPVGGNAGGRYTWAKGWDYLQSKGLA